ncbi:MAG: ATP-binding protein [Gallionella sp.]|nr:ATP-binding protein [Gallionella sp.]
MKKYRVKEVFTPTTPARIAFIDRESINDKLVNALEMPGKQLIVYGHSGSGKTTLLANKLDQLYENHITTHCMKGMKFDQIVLDAFDQLDTYYPSELGTARKNTVSAELTATYFLIKSKLQASETTELTKKEQRILPPQLTPQALGKLLGAAKCCWILEDFHKIDDSEKTQLSQLMKVFMDLSDKYEDLKIVALGAVDTARQVVEYDNEMRNRVAEIHVELMTEPEIESIVKKGEAALNVAFEGELKTLIAKYSNGLASVCHHLCMYMCQAAGVEETATEQIVLDINHFESALRLYVEEASDSIRSAFEKALKQRRKTQYHHTNIILEALCSFNERGASRVELLQKIRRKIPKYPEISLKNTLEKLKTDDYGSMLRFNQTAGLFSFSDLIFRVFAMAHFRNNGVNQKNKGNSASSDVAQLIQLLEAEIKKSFPEGARLFIAKGV